MYKISPTFIKEKYFNRFTLGRNYNKEVKVVKNIVKIPLIMLTLLI